MIAWRQRYTREGLAGLADRPRPGRAQTVRRHRRAEILATTLTPPPQDLGVTHWSSRLLAAELGVSHSTIARVWAEHNLKPWQTQTFKFSTDPELAAKVRDVVGLYLYPPEHAIVLCVDEKSQIQALERTQPVRPVRPGRPERHTHDYVHHGTATLFAALEVATGHVTDALAPHATATPSSWPSSSRSPRPTPAAGCMSSATTTPLTSTQRVQAWLGRHPRVQLHFTPTYASWSTWSRCSSPIVERQALRRGDFASAARGHGPSVGSCECLEPALPAVRWTKTPTRSWPSSTVKHLSNGPTPRHRKRSRCTASLLGLRLARSFLRSAESRGHLPGLPQDHQPLGRTRPAPTSASSLGGHRRYPEPAIRESAASLVQEVCICITTTSTPRQPPSPAGRRWTATPHPDSPCPRRLSAGDLALAGLEAGPLRPPPHDSSGCRVSLHVLVVVLCAASSKKASPGVGWG